MNKNSVLYSDLEYVANHISESFYGKSIFITGGTGLIGSLIIKGIIVANELKKANIRVVAIVRSITKAKDIFKDFSLENITLLEGDIINKISYDENVDYIIHGASPTASKFFVTYPVETITTAVDGTKNLLNFCWSTPSSPRRSRPKPFLG